MYITYNLVWEIGTETGNGHLYFLFLPNEMDFGHGNLQGHTTIQHPSIYIFKLDSCAQSSLGFLQVNIVVPAKVPLTA